MPRCATAGSSASTTRTSPAPPSSGSARPATGSTTTTRPWRRGRRRRSSPRTRRRYLAWRNVAAARVRAQRPAGRDRCLSRRPTGAPRPRTRQEIATRLGWLTKETGDQRAARRYFAKGRGDGPLVSVTTILIAATVIVSLSALLSNEGQAALRRRSSWTRQAVADGEYWRLFTVTLAPRQPRSTCSSTCTRCTWPGRSCERWYGSLRFLLFYLACAAAGSVGELRVRRRRPVGRRLRGDLRAVRAAPGRGPGAPSGRPPESRAGRPARDAHPHQHRLRVRRDRASTTPPTSAAWSPACSSARSSRRRGVQTMSPLWQRRRRGRHSSTWPACRRRPRAPSGGRRSASSSSGLFVGTQQRLGLSAALAQSSPNTTCGPGSPVAPPTGSRVTIAAAPVGQVDAERRHERADAVVAERARGRGRRSRRPTTAGRPDRRGSAGRSVASRKASVVPGRYRTTAVRGRGQRLGMQRGADVRRVGDDGHRGVRLRAPAPRRRERRGHARRARPSSCDGARRRARRRRRRAPAASARRDRRQAASRGRIPVGASGAGRRATGGADERRPARAGDRARRRAARPAAGAPARRGPGRRGPPSSSTTSA